MSVTCFGFLEMLISSPIFRCLTLVLWSLIKFSAFHYTSFIPQPGFLSFLLPVITPWYLYIDKKCVRGVQFSESSLDTETRRIRRTL